MRESGILMHISSLPGPYGIGSMGKNAYEFLSILCPVQKCTEGGAGYLKPLTQLVSQRDGMQQPDAEQTAENPGANSKYPEKQGTHQ